VSHLDRTARSEVVVDPLPHPDGVWDSAVKSLGPYAFAHTNLTEIDLALELLWRNNINPARVVMGLGFYGRSISMHSIQYFPSAVTIDAAFQVSR
jgi:GH18 family chitinase